MRRAARHRAHRAPARAVHRAAELVQRRLQRSAAAGRRALPLGLSDAVASETELPDLCPCNWCTVAERCCEASDRSQLRRASQQRVGEQGRARGGLALRLGSGRIVASETEAPNLLANLVRSGCAVVQNDDATEP